MSVGACFSPFSAFSPPHSFSLLLASASLSILLFCLGAETGNRFTFPQVPHRTTSTSAHGFFPQRLGFSIDDEQEAPSTSIVSQYRHIVRFSSGLCRIRTLSDTARMSVTSWRDIFWAALRSFSERAAAAEAGLLWY